jgi:hypothetical protein
MGLSFGIFLGSLEHPGFANTSTVCSYFEPREINTPQVKIFISIHSVTFFFYCKEEI